MRRVGFGSSVIAGAIAVLVLSASAGRAAAQGLADFDYENLALRGLGVETGYMVRANGVEQTQTYGVRLDLGYLGPGLRIVPSFTYWSSELEANEVDRLETQLMQLIAGATGGTAPDLQLGRITWSDLVVGVDGHFVWNIPFGFLSLLGGGASAHVLNGGGDAVNGTFVEDLLDTVRAGINVHGGLEYPIGSRARVYGQTRYELVEDVQYLELRAGGQIMFGGAVPGEIERR